MINDEQKKRRSTGIFSSDVPRIMSGEGVKVALEKLGEVAPENLDAVPEVQLGNVVEPRILDAYEAAQGKLEVRSPDTMRHAVHRWLGAHLDGLGQGAVIEAKSVGWYNRRDWGEPGTDEVPEQVLWQVEEQMLVAGLSLARVPVCFLNEQALVALATGRPLPIEVYVVPADAELQAYIVERCGKVWQHIEAKTLPAPEQATDARLIYRKDSGAIVEADLNTVATHIALLEARVQKAKAEEREDALIAELQAYMKDASELRYQGRMLTTWKLDKGRKGYTVAARAPVRKFLVKD